MSSAITDEAMKVVVSKFLLETLSAEEREKLLLGALKALISERHNPGDYRDQRSQLQYTFDSQLAQLAHTIVRDWLKEPETLAKLREPIVTAVDKILGSDDFVERLVRNMTAGLWDNSR